MPETSSYPTKPSEPTDGLAEAAARAEAWAGEPFLWPEEDPADVLAPGRARRMALDEALEEMAAGRRAPSPEWKVRHALMLGLERVVTDHPPRLASGTELRRHQIDALAGMLAELIAKHEQHPENGNGNGNGHEIEPEDEDEPVLHADEEDDEPEPDDPGAERRFRFRHPTASGKTIAAAGFVEAARTMGVLILTHRRLLVTQFNRDLTTEGYGDRFSRGDRGGPRTAAREPDHDPDLRLVRAPRRFALAQRLPARDLRRGPHGARREDERRDPPLHGADLHRHDRDRAADRQAGLGRLPRLGRRPPARRRRAARADRAAALAPRPPRGRHLDACRSSAATTTRMPWPRFWTTSSSTRRPRASTATASTTTPGIVYAAGVEHAYNLAREFRAAGLKAEAVSGRTPPLQLAETLAAYERGEINVLINAQLLAEGWNSPRATVCMHLAPTASKRVYQQRIGRVMRTHPRKEAGVVVDFVDPAATHNERTVTIHSLLDSDFYRPGRACHAGAAAAGAAPRQAEALAGARGSSP